MQWGENFPPIFEIRNWIFVELRGFSFRTGLETFKNVIFRAAPAAGCQKEGNKGLFNEFLKMIPPFLRKSPPHFLASELNGGNFPPHSERKMKTLVTRAHSPDAGSSQNVLLHINGSGRPGTNEVIGENLRSREASCYMYSQEAKDFC